VAIELFGIWVGGGATVCCGVAVPFAEVMAQAWSYCEAPPTGLCAFPAVYACPPVPPLGLLPMKPKEGGSLNTDPGDVAALPGEPDSNWQVFPWGLGAAYAGAAPMTATPIMQLA
jgi:hypothetical protein